MSKMKRGAIALMVTGSMAGGALGATVLSATSSSAATTTTSTTTTVPPGPDGYGGQPPQNGGVFHSNENATHEKGESAQREAQETAGQFPTVP
jgi:hypothetical protein